MFGYHSTSDPHGTSPFFALFCSLHPFASHLATCSQSNGGHRMTSAWLSKQLGAPQKLTCMCISIGRTPNLGFRSMCLSSRGSLKGLPRHAYMDTSQSRNVLVLGVGTSGSCLFCGAFACHLAGHVFNLFQALVEVNLKKEGSLDCSSIHLNYSWTLVLVPASELMSSRGCPPSPVAPSFVRWECVTSFSAKRANPENVCESELVLILLFVAQLWRGCE